MFSLRSSKKNPPSAPESSPPSPEPMLQPQGDVLEPPLNTSSPNESTTHIDRLIADTEDSLAGAPIGGAIAPTAGMLKKDEFHKSFIAVFKFGHGMSGLQSLHIPPERAGAAEECTSALYESIIDIPALHFMLKPGNKWWGRALAIGTFTIPMAIGVSAELRARVAARHRQSSGSASTARQPIEGEPTAEQAAALGA